ncbi:MAG: DUF3098 domain-containing protein [Bacteroidales bacterium]|jgi:membrane-bound ClpP family serine protease|nr:DUF3098 domain-containing protein [Bacteroidales bacterium]
MRKSASFLKNSVSEKETKGKNMPFHKDNYIFLLIGLAFIVIGFLLMINGSSNDPDVFSEEIYSFRRITLSPILIVAGFIIEIYAIMKKPKSTEKKE